MMMVVGKHKAHTCADPSHTPPTRSDNDVRHPRLNVEVRKEIGGHPGTHGKGTRQVAKAASIRAIRLLYTMPPHSSRI